MKQPIFIQFAATNNQNSDPRRVPVGRSRASANLQHGSLSYVSDSQDLEALGEFLPAMDVSPAEITGALVETGEGEYVQVWVTESSRPFSTASIYTRVI